MTDWTRVVDAYGETGRVPVLLDQVERAEAPEAWKELSDRLCLLGETVSPASFAALPQLTMLAPSRADALELAGEIMCNALRHPDGEVWLAGCAATLSRLRRLVDRHLQTRPAGYHRVFCALLAIDGQYHWSAALGDFTDDFYTVSCPHCGVEVTIAIGDYGRYSAIRDWMDGDIDRRLLRPTLAEELADPARWMHATAIRDGQPQLALDIRHLFGHAECPRCASVFGLAEAYTIANLPTAREA